MTRTDGELLQAYSNCGDQAAFSEILRRHAPMVLRICRRLVNGDAHAAEDALQQVFLMLAHRAKELSTRPSIAGWLYRAAWHVGTRLRRDRGIRASYEFESAALRAAEQSSPAELVSSTVITLEMSDALGRALATLPETYRDALVLHYFAGYTVEETARTLQVSTGTAASWLSRGRAMLRTRLDGIGAVVSTDVLAVWIHSYSEPSTEERWSADDAAEEISRSSAATGNKYAPIGASTAVSLGVSAGGVSSTFAFRAGIAAILTIAVTGSTMAAGGPANAIGKISSVVSKLATDAATKVNKAATPEESDAKEKPSFSSPNRQSFGGASAIPEPSTSVILVGLGFALLTKRRRRSAGPE